MARSSRREPARVAGTTGRWPARVARALGWPRALFPLLGCLLAAAGAAAAPGDARAAAAEGPGRGAIAGRSARVAVATAAQARHTRWLLETPDVVGTAAGLGADGAPEVVVFTARPGVSLPARLDGVRVRVRVSGRFHALRAPACDVAGDGVCEPDERWPLPVPIGVSVGHPDITAGTLGARVTDGVDVFALSNNHVLAAINQAVPGDPVLQPGSFDGGGPDDAIGALADFEPLVFCAGSILFPSCPQSNLVDAAVALTSEAELGVATPVGELGSVPGYGVPSAVLHAAYGDPVAIGDEDLGQLQGLAVQKHGRTTGLTTGQISAVSVTADVCYDQACSLIARFVDQLAVGSAGFSAGGDSGSLVVSDDGGRNPVGLLFAGSETQTLVNRIDHALVRFGVGVDDGGTTPALDAAVSAVTPPGRTVVGHTASVTVTVRNAGTEALPAFDVELVDATEASTQLAPAPPLGPGASAERVFSWTPAVAGSHVLVATALLPGDENDANDSAFAEATVLETAPEGPWLELWQGVASTSAWTPVSLARDYGDEMVVVCTPAYDAGALGPLVARVRGASGSGFEVGLGRPWFGAFPGDHGTATVHCMVVRAGVYLRLEHGVRMEAVRVEGYVPTDGGGSWVGAARSFSQGYTTPVVLGQVISDGSGIPGEIGAWSTFWSRGATAGDPPTADVLHVGRHTGEDPTSRPSETLAYVVVEAGGGTMSGVAFQALLGDDVTRGVGDAPPYPLAAPGLASAVSAVASPAGMDGLEGGWPILYGPDPVAADAVDLAIDLAIEEDWYFDSERSHPTEQVAVLVFGTASGGGGRCGLGFELVGALALWRIARARRRRLSSTRGAPLRTSGG